MKESKNAFEQGAGKKSMKVLHVCRTLDPVFGGPPDSVRMFCAAHQRNGTDVEVVCTDDPKAPFTQIENVAVHALGPARANYFYLPRMEKWIRENVERFDGIIINGIWQYHSLAARRAIGGKRPFVVFPHGMLDPYFNRRYPLKYIKKFVYWTLFEHQSLTQAQKVCFTSDEEMRIAAKGFPFRKFDGMVIPYGTIGPPVDADPVAYARIFRERFPQIGEAPFLLYLGRIHPKKGCDLLLEAFAQSAPKEMKLAMVGPDGANWIPELKEQADRLGIGERVCWTGMLRDEAKWGSFYASEAFILPSHQENFGIAVADALACHTIPLISDQVNIAPEVAADGAGVVERDTMEGTVRLIERFMALTEAERVEMRRLARRCYERRYALTRSAQALEYAMGLRSGYPEMESA